MLQEIRDELDKVPIPDGFEEPIAPFFVDVTFEQFWDIFYKNGAEYDIESHFHVYNDYDELISSSDWFEPTETQY